MNDFKANVVEVFEIFNYYLYFIVLMSKKTAFLYFLYLLILVWYLSFLYINEMKICRLLRKYLFSLLRCRDPSLIVHFSASTIKSNQQWYLIIRYDVTWFTRLNYVETNEQKFSVLRMMYMFSQCNILMLAELIKFLRNKKIKWSYKSKKI